MQKGVSKGLINSTEGKVNLMLFLGVLAIFLAFLISEITFVEAGMGTNLTIRAPGNFTFNATSSRNINFTFNITWQGVEQNYSGNCSLWVNSTTSAIGWVAVKNVSNLTRYLTPTNDDYITNYTGSADTISYMNYTFPADGNYTVAIACLDKNSTTTNSGAGYNFSANYTFVLDTTPPNIIAVTPNATLKTGALWTGQASGNFSAWPILFLLNVSDNNTHTVWYILNASITTMGTWTAGTHIGELENATNGGPLNNLTMARSIVGSTSVVGTPDVMDQYNGSVYLNLSSPWRSPGPHSVVFCANDSAGNKRCIGSYDFVITGTNVTQMENMFSGISLGSTGVGGFGLNITFGNGTEIPAGDADLGGAPPAESFFNPVTNNYTFVFNISQGQSSKIYLVGLKIDETKLANATSSNITTAPEKEILSSVGYGFNTTYTGGDFANFMPDFVRFQFGVIEQAGVGFNRHMFCSGATIANPNCTAIFTCNATAFGVYNNSNVLTTILSPTSGGPSACYLEGDKGQLNGVALTAGKTYTFVTHFSGGALGNDTGAPEIQLFGNLVNGDKYKTRHETPLFSDIAFNTSSSSIIINFTVADINSTGINMSINNTINVSISNNGGQSGKFYVSGIYNNLTCTPVGYATNSSVFNITGTDVQGNLTSGVSCNLTLSGLTNGTKNITIMARDASNNSNTNVTSVLITIDQIPPYITNFTICGNVSFGDGTTDACDSYGSSVPSQVQVTGGSGAQGKSFSAIANFTDNLTQILHVDLQFFNTSSGWQTANTTTLASNRINISNNGLNTNATVNFTFTPPKGHNEFEGKNITFRILVNDTLGNKNTNGSDYNGVVINVTININDTTKPTVIINGTIEVNGTNTTNTRPVIGWFVKENNKLLEINVSVDAAVNNDNGCNKFARYTTALGVNNIETGDSGRGWRNGSIQIASDSACTLGNGTHFVVVQARDTWGNLEMVNHTFTVQSGSVPALVFNNVVDDLNLQIVSNPSVSAVNKSNLTSKMGLNFSGLGGSISIANLSYVSSCNSTSPTVYFKNNTAVYPFNESTCPTTSSNVTLKVTITDTAGTSNSTVFGFTLDNVAPTITVRSPTSGQTFSSISNVNVSAFDSESQIQWIGYYLDGVNTLINHTINASRLTDDFGQTNTYNRTINFTPGTHTIKISVNDTLGNIRNSSEITFTQTGPVTFLDITQSASNYSTAAYGENITNVTVRIKTGTGYETVTTANETSTNTFEIYFEINGTSDYVNLSLTEINGSAMNWQRINFTPIINDTQTEGFITTNWTNTILRAVTINNSLTEFIGNNNSYYGVVILPLNDSNRTPSGPEFWWFPNVGDTATKTNISQCTGGFSRTDTTPCWNYTSGGRTIIQVPHFSTVAAVNDSSAPTINVTTPTTANQTVSMFLPNITVSSDANICKYQLNSSTPINVTMTKTGTVCIGQTERLKNLESVVGYNITFWVTDNSGNTNQYRLRFNVSDNTAPNNGPVTSSAGTTTATVTITGTNESVNATVAYGTTNTSLSSVAMETDFNTTQDVSLTVAASTTYYYNVTVCDYNGNCKTNTTVFSFATSAAAAAAAAAATTSSGGGGGAAAPSNEVATAARKWDNLAAGSSAVLTINKESIAVTGVIVDVKNAVANAEVKVASLASNPLSTAAAAKVHQYLQITKSNIADTDTSKIAINFKVPKSWLTTNNVAEDDVVLYRYSDSKWNALPTAKTGADVNNVLYQSTTPGFSTFAIGGKEAAPAVTPPTETPTTEAPAVEAPTTEQPTTTTTPAAPEEKKGLSSTALAWIVVLVIVVVAGIGYFMWQKKKSE